MIAWCEGFSAECPIVLQSGKGHGFLSGLSTLEGHGDRFGSEGITTMGEQRAIGSQLDMLAERTTCERYHCSLGGGGHVCRDEGQKLELNYCDAGESTGPHSLLRLPSLSFL